MKQSPLPTRHIDHQQPTEQLANMVELRPGRPKSDPRPAVPGVTMYRPAPQDNEIVRILVVDGEPASATMISSVLIEAGFEVATVTTGAAALHAAAVDHPDLIVLELVLPDMRGEDALNALLAAHPGRRVIVVSTLVDIFTRVAVLTSGAVDYMAKPFANIELVARVRARTRDPEIHLQGPPPYPVGYTRLELNIHRQTLIADGKEIRVTPTESRLLFCLLQRAPAVCARDDLLASMLGTAGKNSNMLEVYIRRLRTKLAPTKIEAVRNKGYRIIN